MSFFSNIFSSGGSVLGIDIGTTSIKAVELRRSRPNPRIVNYALLESYAHFQRSNSVIQANSLTISEKETVELLKMLLKRAKFGTKNVIASVPSFASYTTVVEMPAMSQEDTERAMSYQIQQSIPLPISKVAVDWTQVGQREDSDGVSKQIILIIAIPNDTIQQFHNIFKKSGLSLKALEVEHVAYTRAIIGGDKTPTLILDIGARSSNITVADQGFVKNNSQIDYAGDSLTESITKGLNIDYGRAEELKKREGILGGGGEYELSTLQTPFIDVILREASKARQRFESTFSVPIKRILLMGGGAELAGISDYVEKHMQLPTALANGLLYATAPGSLNIVSKELQTRFATSIGLALKQFIK